MMHLTIVAFGAHGDVQPMVALGKGLQAAGHTVQIIAGQNFVAWVQAQGVDCIGTVDVMALMQSPEGVAMVENPRKQLQWLKQKFAEHADALIAPLQAALTHSDVIISGFTSDGFVRMLREIKPVAHVSVPLQPYQPTRSGAATLMTPLPRGSSVINLWIGEAFQGMMQNLTADMTRPVREALKLPPFNKAREKALIASTPVICGFSRHVVPPQPDWGRHVQVAGYLFLDHPTDYQPPPALTEFLANGAPPLYVGFGSMTTRNPDERMSLICDALERAEQRGVIMTGWSGAKLQTLPRHVYVLEQIPHSWLFTRVAGVVHHGGAGTSAAGLRAGVPSLLVPYSVDQPYWARRLYELGVSAPPIPQKKLTVERLAQGMRALVNDRALRERAAQFGALIRDEAGVAAAVRMIEQATA